MTHLFWTPEPIWRGETAFLLGGGPSLKDVDLTRLRGRRVVTINSSHRPAIDAGLDDGVLFFTDTNWWEAHSEVDWRGLIVTCAASYRPRLPSTIRQVVGERRPDFPKLGAAVIKKGRSSGHTAVGLAVALGAQTIVLLGFDARAVDGRTHHHDEYGERDVSLYAESFVPAFGGWNAAALARGVTILNATPDSAITEFPMVDLTTVLRMSAMNDSTSSTAA